MFFSPRILHRFLYRYRNMSNLATAYTLSTSSRVCSVGTGGKPACVYRQSFEINLPKRIFFLSNFTGKEKDYESGFHYYGARYYWSELLTGWLSVDPMMDKYPSLSPYNYCAWNPVKLVDPDGKDFWEDWYKNIRTGKVVWHEGHALFIVDKKGDIYTNIGESYSKPIGNGQYINYYQNCSITIGEKQDAAKLAYYNSNVRTTLIRRTSPLPTSHKQELFNNHVASRGVSLPDMVGIQLSGSAIVGGGYTLDITFGYLKEYGLFLSVSPGAGIGFDISAGIGFCVGRSSTYSYSKESLSGLSFTYSTGYGRAYYQQSFSATKNNHWKVSTYGISLGSSTLMGGSAGVSYSFLFPNN